MRVSIFCARLNAFYNGMSPDNKKPRRRAVLGLPFIGLSALADLQTRVLLVNYVDATLAAYHSAILVPDFRRFQ